MNQTSFRMVYSFIGQLELKAIWKYLIFDESMHGISVNQFVINAYMYRVYKFLNFPFSLNCSGILDSLLKLSK